MIVRRSSEDMRKAMASRRAKGRIALVPTMGFLHEGHLSLIRRAKRMAETVIVSIYVNPLQFGPGEDLVNYPRSFEADRQACEAEGVDHLFCPANLYSNGKPKVTVKVNGLADCLCGAQRPGHFDGVATVVSILFHIIEPDIAVFGRKDFQQLVIISHMVRDLHMPIEIVSGSTVRESDGLAMSSRNQYLNENERHKATALYRALNAMNDAVSAGETLAAKLIGVGLDSLTKVGIEPEYLEVRDAHLAPVAKLERTPARAFVAANIGNARLIDNIALEKP